MNQAYRAHGLLSDLDSTTMSLSCTTNSGSGEQPASEITEDLRLTRGIHTRRVLPCRHAVPVSADDCWPDRAREESGRGAVWRGELFLLLVMVSPICECSEIVSRWLFVGVEGQVARGVRRREGVLREGSGVVEEVWLVIFSA